jgi:hypothetical protein
MRYRLAAMDPALRAGDEDRRLVIDELQRSYVEGRLSSDELSERLDRATAARTFGELAELTSDLPVRQSTQGSGSERHDQWWAALLNPIGVALLTVLAVLFVMYLLQAGHGGAGALPALFLGGAFFFGRSPRSRHRR